MATRYAEGRAIEYKRDLVKQSNGKTLRAVGLESNLLIDQGNSEKLEGSRVNILSGILLEQDSLMYSSLVVMGKKFISHSRIKYKIERIVPGSLRTF